MSSNRNLYIVLPPAAFRKYIWLWIEEVYICYIPRFRNLDDRLMKFDHKGSNDFANNSEDDSISKGPKTE